MNQRGAESYYLVSLQLGETQTGKYGVMGLAVHSFLVVQHKFSDFLHILQHKIHIQINLNDRETKKINLTT
jgi:hypothetical protein